MSATPNQNDLQDLQEEIARTQTKLQELENELEEIGEPAAHDLRIRVEALKVEERALQRNFEEAKNAGSPPSGKMEKVESLLHHIEREEDSVKHEADFLNLGNPSSVSLAVEGGARLYEMGSRGLKRILRDHKPWRSPFVNRSYRTLAAKFHLPEKEDES